MRRGTSFGIWCAAVLLVLAGAVSAAHAQVLYGSLTGSVTDSTQAAVPGASVQLSSLDTGVTKEIEANDSGVYLFSDLLPGRYKVTVSAKAFGAVTAELNVEANRVRRFDAMLKVASVTESVIVSAGAEALQTDRSDINVNVTSRQLTRSEEHTSELQSHVNL